MVEGTQGTTGSRSLVLLGDLVAIEDPREQSAALDEDRLILVPKGATLRAFYQTEERDRVRVAYEAQRGVVRHIGRSVRSVSVGQDVLYCGGRIYATLRWEDRDLIVIEESSVMGRVE